MQMPHGGGHQYSTTVVVAMSGAVLFSAANRRKRPYCAFYCQLKRQRHWNKILVFLKLFCVCVCGVMLGLPPRLKVLNFQ